jgi:hypothetical protein
MAWLDQPTQEVWETRRTWFENLSESYENRGGSYFVSDQASALCGDVEIAFCAGAWIAVVVLAMAVVDSQLRDTEYPDFKGSTNELIKFLGLNQELQWLRRRRNQLVHINVDNPAITLDQQWLNQEQLEKDARKAIELMFEAFFSNPGT